MADSAILGEVYWVPGSVIHYYYVVVVCQNRDLDFFTLVYTLMDSYHVFTRERIMWSFYTCITKSPKVLVT